MKTWLVTGCSTGIGRGIAEAALKSGDQVIVTARNTDKIKDFHEVYPKTALIAHLDLTVPESMENAVREGIRKFGKIDVLVNMQIVIGNGRLCHIRRPANDITSGQLKPY